MKFDRTYLQRCLTILGLDLALRILERLPRGNPCLANIERTLALLPDLAVSAEPGMNKLREFKGVIRFDSPRLHHIYY